MSIYRLQADRGDECLELVQESFCLPRADLRSADAHEEGSIVITAIFDHCPIMLACFPVYKICADLPQS